MTTTLPTPRNCSRLVDHELYDLGQRAATTEAYAGLEELSLNRLSTLPVTEKASVRGDSSRYFTADAAGAAYYFTSSGTTGVPMAVLRTQAEFLDNVRAISPWVRALAGEAAPRCLLSLVDHNRFAVGCLVEGLAAELGAGLFRGFPYSVNGLDVRALAASMSVLRPDVVVVPPGAVIDIEDNLRRLDLFEEAAASVDTVLLLGQTVSAGMRARIRRSWNAEPFILSYGSTETATIALGCRAGVLHALENRYVLEIRHEDGRIVPLADGEHGELIVTPLRTEAMALLRYATADAVEVTRCECGSPGSALRVAGRADDVVYGPPGPMGPEEIEALIFAVPEIQDYLLDVDQDNVVRAVNVQLFPGVNDLDVRNIQDTLKADVRVVDTIPMAARAGALVKSWRRTRTRRRRWEPKP